MKLKIKKLSDRAVAPKFARGGDAGMDLIATSLKQRANYLEYGTDLAMQIEKGYAGLIFPRSSISQTGHRLLNSVGVIDSGYRGEIKVRMSWTTDNTYQIGDKVAQLIITKLPRVNIIEVDKLDLSDRGAGGFGSTGK